MWGLEELNVRPLDSDQRRILFFFISGHLADRLRLVGTYMPYSNTQPKFQRSHLVVIGNSMRNI